MIFSTKIMSIEFRFAERQTNLTSVNGFVGSGPAACHAKPGICLRPPLHAAQLMEAIETVATAENSEQAEPGGPAAERRENKRKRKRSWRRSSVRVTFEKSGNL
jgi:hypothetical protein